MPIASKGVIAVWKLGQLIMVLWVFFDENLTIDLREAPKRSAIFSALKVM